MNRFAIVNAFVKTYVAAVRLVSCLLQGKYIKHTGRNLKTLKTINKYLTMITSILKVHRIVAGTEGLTKSPLPCLYPDNQCVNKVCLGEPAASCSGAVTLPQLMDGWTDGHVG